VVGGPDSARAHASAPSRLELMKVGMTERPSDRARDRGFWWTRSRLTRFFLFHVERAFPLLLPKMSQVIGGYTANLHVKYNSNTDTRTHTRIHSLTHKIKYTHLLTKYTHSFTLTHTDMLN